MKTQELFQEQQLLIKKMDATQAKIDANLMMLEALKLECEMHLKKYSKKMKNNFRKILTF